MKETHGRAGPSPETTSAILAELAAADDPTGDQRISIGEITLILRNRAFGLLLAVFGLPLMLPAPPPIPLICASVVIMVSLNLLGGRVSVWMPRRLSERRIDRSVLARLIRRVLPTVRRIEAVCRPRYLGMTERTGKALFGAVALLLAIIVLLPVPIIGNFTPGLAISVIGLGLSERDGLVMGLGFLLSLAAVAVTGAVGWASIAAIEWLVA